MLQPGNEDKERQLPDRSASGERLQAECHPFPYEIARLAQDLAGGIMVTQPSEADYRNPATHDYIEKYLKGVASVPTEDRMRLLRLIENMTMGTAAVGYLPESMHGAGSPQAQRIMIARQSNLEMKKELAKKIARIK